MRNEKTYTLHAEWENNRKIADLYIAPGRTEDLISVSYDPDWLNDHFLLTLDPEIIPLEGRQTKKGLYGFLQDASPDRWGRTLLQRKERYEAEKENRKIRTLRDTDFLLGVSDIYRTGGIRINDGEKFINNDPIKIPPADQLRKLQEASYEIEKNNYGSKKSQQIIKELGIENLFDNGSSLGGARPKANIIDEKGNLWIAKFSSTKDNDNWKTESWEMTTHDLEQLCGIHVSPAKLMTFGNTNIFLIQRFDRIKNKRKHFASAMTMLQKKDGEPASFMDITIFININCKNPEKDLQELWKRIAFNVAIHNTDCHLRNHGFLLENNTWTLAPAYDVNPNLTAKEMALAITDQNNAIDQKLVKEIAPQYWIKNPKEEIEKIEETVYRNIPQIAEKYKIPKQEIKEIMDKIVPERYRIQKQRNNTKIPKKKKQKDQKQKGMTL